jgi:FkbM family methyltransferase
MGLSPRSDEVADVHGNKMLFGAASEAYVDMVNDVYEPGITRLFDKLIKPGMTVVDIGAHIGYFTLIAAQKSGLTGRVYAFEPAPDNYEILTKNITLNEYENVIPIQKAVCDVDGTTSFYMHVDTVAHSLYPTTIGRGKSTINVETTSLDHFFEQEGWPPVNLIKMDIEGAEAAALAGMRKLIQRNKTMYLFLEFVPQIQQNTGTDPRELVAKLSEMGFTVQVVTEDGLQPLGDKACDDLSLHAELFCEKNPRFES